MLLLRWIFCPADLLALDADRDALVAMPCLSVPCCALLCEAFIILAYSFCLARSGAWFASIWMHVLLFFPTASFIVSFLTPRVCRRAMKLWLELVLTPLPVDIDRQLS